MGSVFFSSLKKCFHSINIQSKCVSACCVKDADIDIKEEHHHKHKKHHHHEKKSHDDKEKNNNSKD